MAISLHELEEIKRTSAFSNFIHTNLHIHTPATPWDWNSFSNQTINSADLTPEKYFEYLNKTTLDLVAITDHNCVSWCKPIIELAQKARSSGQSKLYVLPGVEITTYEGPHIIAIFDEHKDISAINSMLIRLGLSGDGGKDEKISCHSPNPDITISNLLDEVEKEEGIIIAPHADSKDGIWGNPSFRGRIDILNDSRVKILAVSSGEIKRVEEDGQIRLLYKNMDTSKITNTFAFINTSDCHRVDDFELNTTWIKMSKPGLAGIRQIIFEPELRVAHELIKGTKPVDHPTTYHFKNRPKETNHGYISGIAITGGMLDRLSIGFSPHQNSVIGKNYAGKSALLDCIRFGMNVIPQFDASQPHDSPYFKFSNRLRAILGEGGHVRIYIQKDTKNYCISRVLTFAKIGGSGEKEKWKIEGDPEVYLLWNTEFLKETDMTVEQIFTPEVYPQGEVVKIKDNANQQMSIVDAIAKIKDELSQVIQDEISGVRTVLGELKFNAKTIIGLSSRKDQLNEQIGDVQQLEDEITNLEALVSSDEYRVLKKWIDLHILISDYRKDISELIEYINSYNLGSALKEKEIEDDYKDTKSGLDENTTVEEFENEVKHYYRLVTSISTNFIKNGVELLEQAIIRLDELQEHRLKREEAVRNELRSKSKSDDQNIEDSIFLRITQKRETLNDKNHIIQERDEIEQQLQKLNVDRQELLTQYKAKWEIIREKRRKVVELIDSNSADNIHASLREGYSTDKYRKLLESIADHVTSATAKISNKQNQLELIVDHIIPENFLRLIRAGNVEELMSAAPGLTANTARLFIGINQADIMDLEQCILDDMLIISYRKEGDDVYTPIDNGLSGGEQALALISVAMVPKDMPLLIDQPEDELGPALITKELVDQIRMVKADRQLIFVTHVPNIPVLADSEQIIYILQEYIDGKKTSKIGHHGSLDNNNIISHLLELDGGEAAFLKRSERYSPVVKGHSCKR